jgi:hypothetical protein
MSVLAAWFVVTHIPRFLVLTAGNALLAHWQFEYLLVTSQLEKNHSKVKLLCAYVTFRDWGLTLPSDGFICEFLTSTF